LFLFQISIFIVVQLLQKFNDAGLAAIKAENRDNARQRKRLFGVRYQDKIRNEKDEAEGFVFLRFL